MLPYVNKCESGLTPKCFGRANSFWKFDLFMALDPRTTPRSSPIHAPGSGLSKNSKFHQKSIPVKGLSYIVLKKNNL